MKGERFDVGDVAVVIRSDLHPQWIGRTVQVISRPMLRSFGVVHVIGAPWLPRDSQRWLAFPDQLMRLGPGHLTAGSLNRQERAQ